MPVWLMPLLINLVKGLWHAICRFWSVFLIAAVLLSCWLWWRGFTGKMCSSCKAQGYAQCVKDRPTYGTVGVVNNGMVTTTGFELDGWGIGGWHRRK